MQEMMKKVTLSTVTGDFKGTVCAGKNFGGGII
jgi:hypothetical protein